MGPSGGGEIERRFWLEALDTRLPKLLPRILGEARPCSASRLWGDTGPLAPLFGSLGPFANQVLAVGHVRDPCCLCCRARLRSGLLLAPIRMLRPGVGGHRGLSRVPASGQAVVAE